MSSVSSSPLSGIQNVTIANFAFSPKNLTVQVGTTVKWTNDDTTVHTVTSVENNGPLGSISLRHNDTYQYTFNATGTFHYRCMFYPNMEATVTVVQ